MLILWCGITVERFLGSMKANGPTKQQGRDSSKASFMDSLSKETRKNLSSISKKSMIQLAPAIQLTPAKPVKRVSKSPSTPVMRKSTGSSDSSPLSKRPSMPVIPLHEEEPTILDLISDKLSSSVLDNVKSGLKDLAHQSRNRSETILN